MKSSIDRSSVLLARTTLGCVICLLACPSGFAQGEVTAPKPRIAVFSGPNATIQNGVSLVTSNQAREKHGLALLTNPDGSPARFDHLVAQRLAAPVEILIEQFSAHPLEHDAAELYGPADGYVDRNGVFHQQRQGPEDKPVYKAVLRLEDGLYLFPYMALQANGAAWDDDCSQRLAPADQCRQPFYPDASRIFEEIDRSIAGRIATGVGNGLGAKADFDFYRALPAGGYKKGLPASLRTDALAKTQTDIEPEILGEDFFPYKPYHLEYSARVQDLATATNLVQQALNSGEYLGAIWLEGSPSIEEISYWLSLLIDTTRPIIGNASNRFHGAVSADGPRNLIDSVDFIVSRVWQAANGKNELGAVVIQDEQIFAARQVQKADARPGGYRATGEHGGILGTIGDPGSPVIWFKPTTRHTWRSEVNLSTLPETVNGIQRINGKLESVQVQIKTNNGLLRGEAIPKVTLLKVGRYMQDTAQPDPDHEVEILARIEKNLGDRALAGIVAEGLSPYGRVSPAMRTALEIAALSGMPVVLVGRGDAGGLTPINPYNLAIEGSNLTATKARYLLKASLMKIGSLPVAKDPGSPTTAERKAVQTMIEKYQEIFFSH